MTVGTFETLEATEPHVALPLRLNVDRRILRETMWLRATAALVTIFGSIWLAFTQHHWSLMLVGVLAGLFGVTWLMRGLREYQRALETSHYVELDQTGIAHRIGGHVTQVPWGDVTDVRVDEDRLVVAIETESQPAGKPQMILEPCFAGLGVYDLRNMIADAKLVALETPQLGEPSAAPIRRS